MDNQVLRELAEKLGVTVEYLWNALLRQALIGGICDVMFLAGLTFCTWNFVKWARQKWDVIVDESEPVSMMAFGIGSIALMAMWLVAMKGLPTTMASFFNPEYWALHEVLKAVRK